MARAIRITLGAVFLPALVAGTAAAQPAPGTEFLVNVQTTDNQGYAEVAGDGRGGFVVLWNSYGQDGDRAGLFARRFDRRGAPRGGEIAVNTYTTDNQQGGNVASDAHGNFVVTWERREPASPSGFHFVGRRFDRTGAALGPEFLVSSSATAWQRAGDVAMHPDGRFVAVWSQDPQGIVARRFDATGTAIGVEFALNETPFNLQVPRVAAAPDGGFLATWNRFDLDGTKANIYARRVGPAGGPLAGEFRVNSDAAGYDYHASTSFDEAGRFVVAWHKGPTVVDTDVFARRFDAAGAPIGADFRVNDATAQRQAAPRVTADRDGGFIVMWTGNDLFWDVYARRFDASAAPLEAEFRVPSNNAYFQIAGNAARAPGGHFAVAYSSEVADFSADGVLGRLLGVAPMAMSVDATPLSSNGNGVLEAGETVSVAPSWANADRGPLALTGTLSAFTGPGSSTYTITDGVAAYGTVAVGATSSCASAANCYALSVTTPATRPALHWDASARERVMPRGDMDWPLHVGASFADVPPGNGFYRFVETLLHHGVTAGCAAAAYCPGAAVSREQMTVFVLSAHEGAGYQPRACATPLFPDVPAASPFCRFVEELARRGVVSGCGGGNFCPSAPVTRAEMAVFVLRTREPALTPPACGTPMFADVPASDPFCRWIEELARRGVVAGCGGGNYCPAAPVTREQMSVFISAGFGLTLYGP
jgi:hypothetical protein